MEEKFASVVSMSDEQVAPSPALLLNNLPIDSLHGIAGFLTCSEWSKFGQTCHTSNRTCREVFKRMKLHGFRCAMEVISALVRTYYHYCCCYVGIHLFLMPFCWLLLTSHVCMDMQFYILYRKKDSPVMQESCVRYTFRMEFPFILKYSDIPIIRSFGG